MNIKQQINKLSPAEKILLVEEIWDDIADEHKRNLSKEKVKEIKRRIALEDEGKVKYYSWDEARKKIKALKKNV
jgi:putative addiction module component (TIGR02574 family)